MKNPLKLLGRQSSMSHVAFQKTVGELEEIRHASANDGKHRIGHLVRRKGAVGVSTEENKGSRSKNNAFIKGLTHYLKKHPDRFEAGKAKKALGGLTAAKGMKDIDLTFLAEDFKGLVPPEVRNFDFAQARKQVREESNQVWKDADKLADETSPRRSADSAAQVNANAQALKSQVIASGGQFAKACLPGVGQRHPKDAKRLANSLSKELSVSDLTRSLGVEELAGLVEQGENRLAAQRVELEALLAQKGKRDQDPAFHQKVKNLSEALMRNQSMHVKTLAFIANRLSDRDLRQLPPDFSLVTATFAKDLVAFLKAQLEPGSLFMEANRLAAESKALAHRRLTELESQGPELPASEDTLRQDIVARMDKAKTAYKAFEDACFKPQGGSIALSDEQKRLRQQINDGLLNDDATTRLPLGAVKGNLFRDVPDRIQQLNTDLSADVNTWAKSPDAVLLNRIRVRAQELDELIGAYLAQLNVVAHILLTKPSFGDLTPELEAARLSAGNSMLQLRFVLDDPSGDLMRIQAYARQTRLDADEQRKRIQKVQPMAGEARPAQNDDFVDESSLPILIPLAEPKTKATNSPIPLVSPAIDEETAAFAQEVDQMVAELLAEIGQPVPPATPVLEANQPRWLAELPPDESQYLAKPIRSSQQPDRRPTSFLTSDDGNAFEEMFARMDAANVSLATPRGRGELDREESLDLSLDAEDSKRPDEVPSWRLAGRPYSDPLRTNRLAAGRELNAVRMDKAADAFTKAWAGFVKKCLVPADGLHGLSDHQRLVKGWWAGLLPKTSYDPATHNADADMPLAHLEPGDFADVFVTEWPRNLEARRQGLQDLLLLKDRLKNRGADVHQQLNDRIQRAATSLERDLVRYVAQIDTLAKGLTEQKGFPVNVPAGFSVATSEAGRSLQALSQALKAPMARAHRLIQDARKRSAVAR